MKPIRKYFTLPIISLLKKMDLYSSYLLRTASPMQEDGWFRSFKEQSSVDATGSPVPWITYPAYEFLRRRIDKEMSVFEFGCGGSTFWWASNVKRVVSVEHDKEWYKKVFSNLPSNVTLTHIELEYGGHYAKEVSKYRSEFDVIVIDGRDRVNCALNALGALTGKGIIIWDNSDREEYKAGYDFLLDNGFRQIEFIGLSPALNCRNETSIFYRSDNCLGL